MEHCASCPDEGVESIPAFLGVYDHGNMVKAGPQGEIVLCGHHSKSFHDAEQLNFDWCASCGAWRTADLTCWDCESPLANSGQLG